MKTKMDTVKTLLEALPFIKDYSNEIVVIKYGGSAQNIESLKAKFAKDILLMYLVGIRPVIVHGGGPKITQMLKTLNIPSEFIDGQRVSTPDVMRVVEMVLCGDINNEIVSLLNAYGARAVGLSGKDAHFITAAAKDKTKWGLTGDIVEIKASVLHRMINEKFIPVVAPIAADPAVSHPGYNINADLCASRVAIAIGAKKIIFMTDTTGVLDNNGKLLTTLNNSTLADLKRDGTIHGGMVPKVDACLEAVRGGIKKAHIIDGRIEHSILLELFTADGIGTQILSS